MASLRGRKSMGVCFFAATIACPAALAQSAAPAIQQDFERQVVVPGDADTLRSVHRHDGFFFRGGIGPAFVFSRGRRANENGDIGFDDRFSGVPPEGARYVGLSGGGLAAHMAMGGTPARGFVTAFELSSNMFWNLRRDPDDRSQAFGFSGSARDEVKYAAFGLLALYYPQTASGFSSGLAASLMAAQTYGDDVAGFALSPELGYGWWVGEQWSMGVVLRASLAGLYGNQSDAARVNVAILSGLVVLTYH